MTFKDWDECLKFLEVLTKWPPIVLLVALLFRSAIAKKLAELKQITIQQKADLVFDTVETLKKAGAKISPASFQQLVLNLPRSAIMNGEAENGEAENQKAKTDNGAKDEKEANVAETQFIDDSGSDMPGQADQIELAKQLKALIYKSEKKE